MDRIVIVGTSCSGKTSLAQELAQIQNVPHIELDTLHWLPDWQMRPLQEFRAAVSAAIAGSQ
ncbi:MAG: adenylate kinase, partial [Anaerolineales bacterium]